jgi:hypothetical protein
MPLPSAANKLHPLPLLSVADGILPLPLPSVTDALHLWLLPSEACPAPDRRCRPRPRPAAVLLQRPPSPRGPPSGRQRIPRPQSGRARGPAEPRPPRPARPTLPPRCRASFQVLDRRCGPRPRPAPRWRSRRTPRRSPPLGPRGRCLRARPRCTPSSSPACRSPAPFAYGWTGNRGTCGSHRNHSRNAGSAWRARGATRTAPGRSAPSSASARRA